MTAIHSLNSITARSTAAIRKVANNLDTTSMDSLTSVGPRRCNYHRLNDRTPPAKKNIDLPGRLVDGHPLSKLLTPRTKQSSHVGQKHYPDLLRIESLETAQKRHSLKYSKRIHFVHRQRQLVSATGPNCGNSQTVMKFNGGCS